MTRMSLVWDRAAEVMRGRGGVLALIALLLSFLPSVVQNALNDFLLPRSPLTFAPVLLLVLLVSLVLGLWSNLSLAAAASDPAIGDAGQAIAVGGRRVPPLLGIAVLATIAAIILAIPAMVIIVTSMFDLETLRAHPDFPLAAIHLPSTGALVGFGLYMLAFFVLAFWLSARLFVLVPVIVNERRGLGALSRSFELTRGLTWRIIGVQLLFLIVFGIAVAAVQAVLGVVARLALGPDRIMEATFVAQLGVAVVTAAYVVVVTTFSAQLYRATSGWEAARAFA